MRLKPIWLAMMNESFDAQAEVRGLDHQLEALSKQASGPVADAVGALRKKVSALAGSRGGGFFAPPSPEVTLSHVAGEMGRLYGQVEQRRCRPHGNADRRARRRRERRWRR